MPAVSYKARSITELLAIRVRDQPDDPAVYTGIAEPDSSIVLRSLTYSQVQAAVDRLAWYYSTTGIMPQVAPGEIPPPRIIAVFTSSSIDESFLELALAKLGLTALLLSVNNSTPAVAHLTKLTKATHIIYSAKFSEEAKEAKEILHAQGYTVGLVEDKRYPLWGPGGIGDVAVKPFGPILTPDQEKDRPGVILHSSGSTGFPKPVYVTHYGFIANIALNQNKTGFSTLPVYHGYGHFAIFRCMYCGKPITLFPPHLPLTSANICAILDASPDVRQCYAVPYVIKLLGETPEGVAALAKFDVVGFAGAAVPDDLGDRLTAAGVNLFSIYGTTETGGLMNSNRDMASDKAWNWVRATGLVLDYLVMEPRGDNMFEAVVKDGYPPKVETNRPDGSFATKDLFLRHPEHDNWYKYISRLDDTLVQSLGEKTNPVPMELCIRGNSPYVAEAIVFGAGKPQTGCLILPTELGKDLSAAELMQKVWPVIEQANADAPTHSRLLPEMIEFLPYGTHVPVATKMSILRPACYITFKDLLESIYQRFEQGDKDVEKLRLPKLELEQYILDTISKTLGPVKAKTLDRQVDLFSFGVDSLQTIRIRNIMQKELFLSDKTLGQNVVYEYPSLEKLADHILSLQSGEAQSNEGQDEAKMIAMVDKWVAKIDTRKRVTNGIAIAHNSHVIVLSGATGSLGAHILQQLVKNNAVRKVICLSRASSHEQSLYRVKESLTIRKLPLNNMDKVQSYAADVTAPFLGLSQAEYDGIREEVTEVIHNAWPVNFVLSIDSYDHHVGGALNLINLCLASPFTRPASFFFSSSIGALHGTDELECAEIFSSSPKTAVKTGYARSKWVVEKLCERAAEISDVATGILRIGQMTGDTESGIWNETEAWPLLFKSANTLGVLPRLDENPSWLPVDFAGRGVVEVVLAPDRPKACVYHIVNPNRKANWDDVLDGLKAAGLRFDVVDRMEWLERLEASDTDANKNPTIKLLSYYRMRNGKAHRRPMIFLADRTSEVAPSIRDAPALDAEIIGKWVARWRETGFLST